MYYIVCLYNTVCLPHPLVQIRRSTTKYMCVGVLTILWGKGLVIYLSSRTLWCVDRQWFNYDV